ncbi:MAG: RNA polymerase sigma factor [Rhodopirellula sp. JB044]|uniref:RNA polymerase sigma factor n=1 Tax=Rhodopirellula sp. JB044 TaxID=3342844 RepID=UPI00370CBA3F
MRSNDTTSTYALLPDDRLVGDARIGNRAAFEELVRRYHSKLTHAIRSRVSCRMTVDDIVQDAWIKAFQNLTQLRVDGNFYYWLLRIAMNSRRTYFQNTKQADWTDPQLPQVCQPRSSQPEAVAERNEDCQRVRHALMNLDEGHRRILVLRDYEQQDYREISETLSIKVGTVRSRLHRARSQLRNQLKASSTS